MKRMVIAIAFGLLLTGCTHTRTFNIASSNARTELNARAEGRTTTLTLQTGESVSARSVSVAPDRTTWIDPATGAVRSVPTREVATVRFDNRGRGALEGLGWGAAIGAGVGVLVGAVSGATDDNEGIEFYSPLEVMVISGIVLGATGGLVGAAVGTIRQRRTVYDFSQSPQSSPEPTEDDME